MILFKLFDDWGSCSEYPLYGNLYTKSEKASNAGQDKRGSCARLSLGLADEGRSCRHSDLAYSCRGQKLLALWGISSTSGLRAPSSDLRIPVPPADYPSFVDASLCFAQSLKYVSGLKRNFSLRKPVQRHCIKEEARCVGG